MYVYIYIYTHNTYVSMMYHMCYYHCICTAKPTASRVGRSFFAPRSFSLVGLSPTDTPNLPTNIIPTNIARLELSGKSTMGLGIPPLEIKSMLESNPLKPTMLVGSLSVYDKLGYTVTSTVINVLSSCVRSATYHGVLPCHATLYVLYAILY